MHNAKKEEQCNRRLTGVGLHLTQPHALLLFILSISAPGVAPLLALLVPLLAVAAFMLDALRGGELLPLRWRLGRGEWFGAWELGCW